MERLISDSGIGLRALIDASPLGVAVVDVDGRPIYCNPRSSELHALGADRVGEGRWLAAVHPDDRDRTAASWREATAARRAWMHTYRLLQPDGRTVWVSASASPVHTNGRHAGFVVLLEDVTARKAADAERDELLAREQAAREQAERATRLRDETLAAVAHELRSPLQTLTSAIDALLDVLPDTEVREQLALMARTAAKMDRLATDLLEVSRMEAGSFAIRRTAVPVAPLIDDAVETFRPTALERGLALVKRVPDGLPPADGDRERLSQVLSNLVDNALKFTPAGGRVVVRARHAGAALEISVEDNGPGIPDDVRPKVFERFWQADRMSRRGAGLGLAIAKGIVEAHGGRIWAEPGIGAKLHFTVPAASVSVPTV